MICFLNDECLLPRGVFAPLVTGVLNLEELLIFEENRAGNELIGVCNDFEFGVAVNVVEKTLFLDWNDGVE